MKYPETGCTTYGSHDDLYNIIDRYLESSFYSDNEKTSYFNGFYYFNEFVAKAKNDMVLSE